MHNWRPRPSIETRTSWVVACSVLVILMISSGTPWILVVAMKPVASDLGVARTGPALAGSLTVLGAGFGAIAMGWLASRIGVRWVVAFGSVMICIGHAVAASGGIWSLYIAYALILGALGHACLNSPLQVHVSHWFDRCRGRALALVASGPYVGGIIWPVIFERGLQAWGWRGTMLFYGVLQLVLVLPLAGVLLRRLPASAQGLALQDEPMPGARVLDMPPRLALALLASASFLCCIPMALPTVHLVSLCTDLGLSAAQGVGILSLLQICAFTSRQFWGWLSDRIGGLRSILAGSVCQALAIAGFLASTDETGLVAAAAGFGLGFAGIIPAYALTVRELFPAAAAGWQVPMVSLGGTLGMAGGGWLGATLYEGFGTYATAFAVGLVFNLMHLVLLSVLVARRGRAVAP
ncbi:MFS transporter [Rhodovastum atsumiense]|nr:MFS transporter [Rhodovastum atsumiense]